MADKYDDLLAIRNQSAQQAALRQIQNQAQSEVEDYQRYLAEGDTEKAAWAARGHQALVLEYNTMLANMRAARQQQQAQPQQDQQQYTPAEMDLMREYPEEIRRNWNTAQAAANNLILSKQKADPEADLWAYRNSREYIQGIAHACGVLNSDGTESNEGPLSPNMVCEICKIDADTYNRGAQRLIEDKRAGKYPMSQS